MTSEDQPIVKVAYDELADTYAEDVRSNLTPGEVADVAGVSERSVARHADALTALDVVRETDEGFGWHSLTETARNAVRRSFRRPLTTPTR